MPHFHKNQVWKTGNLQKRNYSIFRQSIYLMIYTHFCTSLRIYLCTAFQMLSHAYLHIRMQFFSNRVFFKLVFSHIQTKFTIVCHTFSKTKSENQEICKNAIRAYIGNWFTSWSTPTIVPRYRYASVQLFSDVVSHLPTHRNVFLSKWYILQVGLQPYTDIIYNRMPHFLKNQVWEPGNLQKRNSSIYR